MQNAGTRGVMAGVTQTLPDLKILRLLLQVIITGVTMARCHKSPEGPTPTMLAAFIHKCIL